MKAAATAKLPRISPEIHTTGRERLQVIHSEKQTTVALILPRGKHFKTVLGYSMSDMGRDQLINALLDWRHVEDELPDDEVRVLIACDGTGEPLFGFHSGGRWQFEDRTWTEEGVSVYAWAHVPGLPAKPAAAKEARVS